MFTPVHQGAIVKSGSPVHSDHTWLALGTLLPLLPQLFRTLQDPWPQQMSVFNVKKKKKIKEYFYMEDSTF